MKYSGVKSKENTAIGDASGPALIRPMTRKHIFVALLFSMFIFVGCNTKESASTTTTATDTTTTNEKIAEVNIRTLSQASADVNFHPEYVRSIARMAYIWGYPMINVFNRRNSFRAVPEPGRIGGVLPAAPIGYVSMLFDYISPEQNNVACPNQDVVYGYGFFELDIQPVILQVPDFGDRFWVYALYDARTEQAGKLGKMYGTKPGFYLMHGPNWKGEIPAGISGVIKSSTELANAIPRVFMDDSDADRKAIQPVINQIVIYPLSEFDGKMKTKDWTKTPSIPSGGSKGGEVQWVVPEKFFDQLPEILEKVAPLPGEEAL